MNKTEWKNEKGETVHFMKIIELLNRIAKGEEAPKKIKHWKKIYELEENPAFLVYTSKEGCCLDLVQCLNDEVEIIEEDKPIEKLKTEIENTERKLIGTSGNRYSIRAVDNILINKINELVKEINKLKENE